MDIYTGHVLCSIFFKINVWLVFAWIECSLKLNRIHTCTSKARVLNDFKENHVSCEMKTSLSSPVSPSPSPSHSNHQLERLFIDPLLPSASSSPLSTPVSFLSRSLPPFVSRAVGQRERDVTGTEIVRGRRMREVGSKRRNDLRRQEREHERD